MTEYRDIHLATFRDLKGFHHTLFSLRCVGTRWVFYQQWHFLEIAVFSAVLQ